MVLVLGGLVWLFASSGHAGGSAGTHPAATPAADEGPKVATALRRLAVDPGGLIASGAGIDQASARRAVPSGSTVNPDVASWAPDGLGGGTMLVTVTPPGGRPATYAAVMVQEQGQWKVL